MTTIAPPTPPPLLDPQALIEEALRRQRRRRRYLALALTFILVVSAAIAASASFSGGAKRSPSSSSRRAITAPLPRTVRLRLLGFGTPLPTRFDSSACPQGRTLLLIESVAGARLGTARLCVLTIVKTDKPNYGLGRIVQTVLETDSLPGGSLVSRQTQTIDFSRGLRHTTARFRGRVVGGSGRYAHARGTVSGGGPGVDGRADWTLTFRLVGPIRP